MAEKRPDRTRGPAHDQFWAFCAKGELHLQRCAACGKLTWPVAKACQYCGSAELAWELLRAHSSWDERQLRSELRRCLGMPGQAPSYTLGERIWLQAREDAMARAGGAFSLKDFHAKALSLGAMGLDPLREALARA